MTTERTRQLLGDKIKDMTDQEVAEMIQKFSRLADVALDLLQNKLKGRNNKCAAQNLLA
ncbi:MAG: hypothetical protein Q8L37_07155 [Candidatus Gottesmanbacteria bacterium]|nr:hypothetical protein [Candidatus Gottesmanbacteria bacterium]